MARAVPSKGERFMIQNQLHDGTMIVAIDGPAGAGKSSVSRHVARELGFAFLDTGAMYRAATWRAITHNVPLDDTVALVRSTEQMNLELVEHPGGIHVFVDGQEVTHDIRTPEITRQIARLDQIPGVRRHLVELQRQFGCRRPTVAEGRDIGTVVFPQARCKIYLDASLECRAKRRAAELEAKGITVSLAQLMEEIKERDYLSMTRADSPLRQAEDAIRIDTTNMTQAQVITAIVQLARERLCDTTPTPQNGK